MGEKIATTYGDLHGAKWATACFICDEIIEEWGDLDNPNTIISEKDLCDDCKKKIKKLIGK